MAEQPSLTAQLGAMWREAVKDVRQTLNETFFGKPEHAPEMGTPMNPTRQVVTQDLGNFHGYGEKPDATAPQKTFDEAMHEAAGHGLPDGIGQDRGMDR